MENAPPYQIQMMTRTKQFIVYPGEVGGRYIGVVELVRLYGIDARDVIVREATPFQRAAADRFGVRFYHLRPRADRVYNLRSSMMEQT